MRVKDWLDRLILGRYATDIAPLPAEDVPVVPPPPPVDVDEPVRRIRESREELAHYLAELRMYERLDHAE